MSEPMTGSPPDEGKKDGSESPRPRRRGSRGGRGRKRPAQSPAQLSQSRESSERSVTADAPDPGPGSKAPGRKPRVGDSRPAPVLVPKFPPPTPAKGVAAAEPSAGGSAASSVGTEAKSPKRRRRGGRGRATGERRGEAGSSEQVTPLDPEVLEMRRGRERKGRPVGRYLMCVHVQESATQLAVLEGLALTEHYVSRRQDDANQIDGNIYIGRVQNVLPGMEAAFVDIGTPKNAVLYRGDVRYDRDDLLSANGDGQGGSGGSRQSSARIEDLLKNGQSILCQVTKNPIGAKGGRLTQEVSIPGRFVVLIPGSDSYGISKRLPDEERKRLRRILDEVRPKGHGIIVRTAAEGASADELRRDMSSLIELWEKIDKAVKRTKTPTLLYCEPEMAVRIIREEFNSNYRGIVIDDLGLYEDVRAYVATISPELADRVEYYDTDEDPLPIFERFHVHEQLHKALDRKVWLQSGGSLIIERTEALTVIDVNTGKNVGTSNLEETVYRNNLEAAEEIARQLRLRDIGGIIVIDFIDMESERNRADVMRAFRDALARDKTRTQAFDISELGLVQMTRKRISEGLVEAFSSTCPTCNGRGIVFDDSLL